MRMGQGATMALPIFAYYMKRVLANPNLEYSERDRFDMPEDYNPCESFVDESLIDDNDIEEIYE